MENDEKSAISDERPQVTAPVPRTRKRVLMPRIGIYNDSGTDDIAEREFEGRRSLSASLITQGEHRFYTLSLQSDVLGSTCIVEPREENPEIGFQRALDRKRAEDIAKYIDEGFGTIPSAIVLSAQPAADLHYNRPNRTISFKQDPKAFLILDGQHRVYGFRIAKSKLRVPVIIYNGLTRTQECRIFIDINTKQRPVPNELLLDIKRLADNENSTEALFSRIYDIFNTDPASPLLGLLSPSERKNGKLSRVTFNAALKTINDAFSLSEPEYVYEVLSAYLHACVSGLRDNSDDASITNPTLFRAFILLFPNIAERVSDRHGEEFGAANFREITDPFFARLKRSTLNKPGSSIHDLHELFRRTLQSGFVLGRGRSF